MSNLSNVLQTDNTAERDEQTNKEGDDDADFTSRLSDLEADQLRDRKEEDNKVEHDVNPTTDVRAQLEVDALSVVFAIPLFPEVAERSALHAKEDAHGYAISGQRGDDSVACICEIARNFFGKDTKVQKNDRDLGKDNDGLIDVLLNPENLNAKSGDGSAEGFI